MGVGTEAARAGEESRVRRAGVQQCRRSERGQEVCEPSHGCVITSGSASV